VIDASAFQLLLMVVTGWLARREREIIGNLIEENRCLRRQLGSRRVRLTDDDRRRLAARAYRSGWRTRTRRGLYADSRRIEERRSLRGAIDDSAHPQGRRSSTRAAPTDLMADVSQGAVGRQPLAPAAACVDDHVWAGCLTITNGPRDHRESPETWNMTGPFIAAVTTSLIALATSLGTKQAAGLVGQQLV
jgi:hypothetical protein